MDLPGSAPDVTPDDIRNIFLQLDLPCTPMATSEVAATLDRTERTGHEWVVSVRGEGVGIDSEDADRVFEVFQSLHGHSDHSGTGIGLALCERIVERHDGEIWVDSVRGNGAPFSFTLPIDGERSE